MKHFSCLEATRLASDALERRLTPMERLRLRLHLMMCAMCRRCVEQFKLIHALAAQNTDTPTLPENARQRIAEALRDCDS
ncbi:MAG: zf-HC2 domain-containing protein [Zetaproteobacteria bacterium]|nr:MAG: zf-HC2 domain-containing protein [Zetaproteobacteria bacterium]